MSFQIYKILSILESVAAKFSSLYYMQLFQYN